MRPLIVLVGGLAVSALPFTAPASAKPLLSSSEDTLARACLRQEDPPERLIELCNGALRAPTLTRRQKIDLLVALGDAHYWTDDVDRARESYDRALDIDPLSTGALNGLGAIALDSEDDSTAFDYYRRAVDSGVTATGIGGLASSGYTLGKYPIEEAVVMLQAAIAIDPDYAWAMREIGWMLLRAGDPDRAREEFRKALAIHDEDLNALYGLIEVNIDQHRYEDALENCNAVLDIAPGDFWGRTYRIRVLRALDRNAGARRDAEELVALFPESHDARMELAQSLTALEQRSEAFEVYRQATEELGDNALLLYWWADALVDDAQDEAALDIIGRSIAADPKDPDSFSLMAFVLVQLERWPDAEVAARTALEISPGNPWALYYSALALAHAEDAEAAMARFREAERNGLPEDMLSFFVQELVAGGHMREAIKVRLGLDQAPKP